MIKSNNEMKLILFACIVVLTTNCQKNNYVKKIDFVRISNVSIPDSSEFLNMVEINVRAEAYNGCWSNLHLVLDMKKKFEYSLSAYGIYETYGICPMNLVFKDTTIEFFPDQQGTYFFYITQQPNEVVIDSMIVQ